MIAAFALHIHYKLRLSSLVCLLELQQMMVFETKWGYFLGLWQSESVAQTCSSWMGLKLVAGALQRPYCPVGSLIEIRFNCKVFRRNLMRDRVRENDQLSY